MTDFLEAADLPDYDEATALVAIAGVTALIRAYCGWHVGPSLEEELTLDGNGAHVLPLPTLRLTAVASVTADYSTTTDPVDVTDDVEWTDRGLLRLPGCWPTRWRSVVATITHGYTLEDLDAVKAVARSAATRLLTNPAQLRSVSILNYAETYAIPAMGETMALALNSVERMVLDAYKLPATP